MLTIPRSLRRRLWCAGSLVIPSALIAAVFGVRVWGQNIDQVSARGQGLLGVPDYAYSLSVEVSLVLVPVTVTDRTGRTILGLGRNKFKVFEDGLPQEIVSFSNEDAPSSVGLVFDVSGSMKNKMRVAREAAHRLLETANPEDEYFLVTFSDRPTMEVDLTQDISRINNRLLFVRPGGGTALLDAVYLALNRLRTARGPRKALVIVSDGGDNHSRYSQRELYSYAVETDAQIHALGIPENLRSGLNGSWLLENMSGATGGLYFEAWNLKELPGQAARIGTALHDRYLLGYRPSSHAADGKWHKIQVKLDLPAGAPPLRVYARQTYQSPAQ